MKNVYTLNENVLKLFQVKHFNRYFKNILVELLKNIQPSKILRLI